MKTLVFSDTHLTHTFDPRLLKFLEKIISPVDAVIINGDFWDSYLTNFDRFTASKWNDTLFPLLKSKNTIYLYGNHDDISRSDSRVSLFSNEIKAVHSINSGDTIFHIEHGHVQAPSFDAQFPFLKKSILVNKLNYLKNYIGIKYFGKKLFLDEVMANKKLKQWKNKNLDENTYFVTGHSHLYEIDESAKFANSGFIQHSRASYLTIEDGKIELHKSRY
jgi:predicted phosphodiesterase